MTYWDKSGCHRTAFGDITWRTVKI